MSATTSQCEHTLHVDGGTWRLFEDKRGAFYACSKCGKFYGRIDKHDERAASATLVKPKGGGKR